MHHDSSMWQGISFSGSSRAKQELTHRSRQTHRYSGNITLDAVINIARILRSKSMAKKLKGTVKEVLGTAFAIGCSVNGQSPADLQKAIDDGSLAVPDE